jgi:dUTP pyrophosphatase
MTIKVLEKAEGCFPQIFDKGDWYDLSTAEDITLKAPQANKMHIRNKGKEDVAEVRTRDVDFDFKLLPLGIAAEIPKGYEAHILPRSSTFKKYGLLLVNSQGIIDNSYKGDNDQWMFPAVATRKITIPKGTRIAQFRVQLSQKATVWQKLKWLFSSKPRLVKVDSLGNPDRKGIGEGTGI